MASRHRACVCVCVFVCVCVCMVGLDACLWGGWVNKEVLWSSHCLLREQIYVHTQTHTHTHTHTDTDTHSNTHTHTHTSPYSSQSPLLSGCLLPPAPLGGGCLSSPCLLRLLPQTNAPS